MTNPTMDKIQEMIATAVAAALTANQPANKAPKAASKSPPTKHETDIAVCRAFKKAGYGDVTPRVDVQTYNRWLAAGLKVRPGEKSTKVKQFRLFHKKQVEPFTPSEKV